MSEEASSSTQAEISIQDRGLVPYSEMWDIQKNLQRALIEQRGVDTLILCEHPPVITIGRSGNRDNLLVSNEVLTAKGVSLYEIERGGDITYHGPGQVVGYPILDLNHFRRDVGWYMRALEEVIIESLNFFGIQGVRVAGRTGVWTEIGARGTNFEPKDAQLDSLNQGPAKIASIGVRISRWCTLHGFSLNVRDCSDGFSLINPCGFRGIEVSSMDELTTVPIEVSTVKSVLIDNFRKVFR